MLQIKKTHILKIYSQILKIFMDNVHEFEKRLDQIKIFTDFKTFVNFKNTHEFEKIFMDSKTCS